MHSPHQEEQLHQLERRVAKLEEILNVQHSFRETEHVADHEVKKTRFDEDGALSHLFAWLKADWLMKLGAFLLILAFAWFVNYAFAHNWIGPVGRIALGIIAGLAILGVGHWQIPKRLVPGQVLVVTGATGILLTIYAARTVYDFFAPASSLVFMALVIALTATVAVIHRTQAVAISALIGGAIVPLLTATVTPNYIGLFAYILLLDLGVLGVVALRSWRFLMLLAVLITGIYAFQFYDLKLQSGERAVWIFMAVFYALFYAATASAIYRSKKLSKIDMTASAISSLLLLEWIMAYVRDEWQSLLLTGVAFITTATAVLLFQKHRESRSTTIFYSALSLFFIGAATVLELEGAALNIALSLEALVVVVLAAFVFKDAALLRKCSVLHLIPVTGALIGSRYDVYRWQQSQSILFEDFFVVLIVTASIAATAILLKLLEKERSPVYIGVVAAAAASGSAFVWLSAHNIFESGDTARAVALVLYTIVGLVLLYQAEVWHNSIQKIFGGIFLGAVILRLLFVEVWRMPLEGRVITFLLIGVLLIGTAFYKRKLMKS